MIGVIEFKYDEKAKPVPVGIGNAKTLARGTSVQAVRSGRSTGSSAVDTVSVLFTAKGVLSNSEANWDQLRYGYLRYVGNLMQGDDSNHIQDTSKFTVRTFDTVAELIKYLTKAGVTFTTDRVTSATKAAPELKLAAGQYTMEAILQLAAQVAAADKVSVSDLKVHVGATPTSGTEQLTNKELYDAFVGIANALPAAAAQRILDKAMGAYNTRVKTIFQKINLNAPKHNFLVSVAKK